MRKYFRTIGGRQWNFYGTADGHNMLLFRAARVTIKRYTKVKGEANPFDPQWEVYFEHRLGVKMERTLQGRRRLLRLWKAQQGICPVCNQKITELTGWHNHHIVLRSKGGPDTDDNCVLLHPNCHHKIHNLKLTVMKPRLEGGEREA
jgi:RNA-directed DNA polymerase